MDNLKKLFIYHPTTKITIFHRSTLLGLLDPGGPVSFVVISVAPSKSARLVLGLVQGRCSADSYYSEVGAVEDSYFLVADSYSVGVENSYFLVIVEDSYSVGVEGRAAGVDPGPDRRTNCYTGGFSQKYQFVWTRYRKNTISTKNLNFLRSGTIKTSHF